MGSVANKIGESLRRYRQQKGLTQAAVGEAVGVSANQIGRYETGKALPREAVLEAAAKLFGCNPLDFFEDLQDLEAVDIPTEVARLKQGMDEFEGDIAMGYLKICQQLLQQITGLQSENQRLRARIAELEAKKGGDG